MATSSCCRFSMRCRRSVWLDWTACSCLTSICTLWNSSRLTKKRVSMPSEGQRWQRRRGKEKAAKTETTAAVAAPGNGENCSSKQERELSVDSRYARCWSKRSRSTVQKLERRADGYLCPVSPGYLGRISALRQSLTLSRCLSGASSGLPISSSPTPHSGRSSPCIRRSAVSDRACVSASDPQPPTDTGRIDSHKERASACIGSKRRDERKCVASDAEGRSWRSLVAPKSPITRVADCVQDGLNSVSCALDGFRIRRGQKRGASD